MKDIIIRDNENNDNGDNKKRNYSDHQNNDQKN